MPSQAPQAEFTPRGRILIIDDDEAIRDSLDALLEMEGFSVESVPDGSSGLAALSKKSFDVVLLDLMLPDISGLELLDQIREFDPETPILLLTAYGSVENAVQAIKRGANNFLTKPWNNDKLLLEIDQTITRVRLEDENRRLRSELRERYSFSSIVGHSETMQKVYDLIAQVSPSRSTVLIRGESGTGKELVARAIHANSPRAGRPFIPVNTGSIPVDLIESALFGHVKGAFTGAVLTRKGYFEMSSGGTLFLDEVSTLGIDTQAKLLRVIQEREFMAVGSNDLIKVDVRIVAATNDDLEQMVAEGQFRKDLYYRLNVIGIELPPLSERRGDIALLAQHFLNKYCRENESFLDEQRRSTLRFTPDAMAILLDHDWPGNVRELENVVERAVVLARENELPVELLPDSLLSRNGRTRPKIPEGFQPEAGASLSEILEEFERQFLIEELRKAGWSQTETAKRLRVALSTLNQKIQRLEIDVKDLKEQDRRADGEGGGK